MDPTTKDDGNDWKETEINGKIVNRRQVCSMLDRAFRCGHSYSGSPLEYYGPIPRKLSNEETRQAIQEMREERLRKGPQKRPKSKNDTV